MRSDEQQLSLETEADKPIIEAPYFGGRRMARFLIWARRLKLGGKAELLLAILAILSAVATYIALSRRTGLLDLTSGKTVQILLRLNGVLLFALMAILARWFVRLALARRANAPGSRLHTRVIGVFIAIAAIPPIIMAVFSALFLEFGIQTWFSEKIRTSLNSSIEVAEAYMVEHRAAIEKDLAAISLAYSRLSPIQQQDTVTLQRVGESALGIRLLSELLVIEERDGEGSVLARAQQSLGLQTSRIQLDLIDKARLGERIITFSEKDNTVVGIARMSSFFRPTYLYVARDVNPDIIGYLRATQNAVADYENLEGKRTEVQLQFNVVFIIVALLILLAAIWLGLWFSSRLVTPISSLVDAAERVGRGDLNVRVPGGASSDEIGTLSRTFNRMTNQLASQQKDLLHANVTLEERRRFLETVLEGVSAGVVGLDGEGRVFLPNRAACLLLGCTSEHLLKDKFTTLFPSFATLLNDANKAPDATARGQITLTTPDGARTLLAQISATKGTEGEIDGFVVTFDDLTEQITHQRTAAWADVARRIAHEIKNPLTPIQLSAERLKRKYSKEIESDPHVFEQCTSTIIRQVGDLRRMVDEFSSFARMPTPLFKATDIIDIIRQAIFLQEVAWPDIKFNVILPSDYSQGHNHNQKPLMLNCDGRLLGQAMTNTLKNAAESIEARLMAENHMASSNEHSPTKDKPAPQTATKKGEITVILSKQKHGLSITISDNGLGLPKELQSRLTEPYVTTRQKGTGLGLAIVRRIMEEHGGSVKLLNRPGAGAEVILSLSFLGIEQRQKLAEIQQDPITPSHENTAKTPVVIS